MLIRQNPDVLPHFMIYILSAAAMVLFMTVQWIFPLIMRFENPVSVNVKNAILLMVAQLPRTLLMTVIWAVPAAVFALFVYALCSAFRCRPMYVHGCTARYSKSSSRKTEGKTAWMMSPRKRKKRRLIRNCEDRWRKTKKARRMRIRQSRSCDLVILNANQSKHCENCLCKLEMRQECRIFSYENQKKFGQMRRIPHV